MGGKAASDLTTSENAKLFASIHAFELQDFTKDEMQAFLPALDAMSENPAQLLHAIYDWVGGNPYMVQAIGWQLSHTFDSQNRMKTGTEAGEVEKAVETQLNRFDANVAEAEKYMLNLPQPRQDAALKVYAQLEQAYQHRQKNEPAESSPRVEADLKDVAQRDLWYAGLAAVEHNPDGADLLQIRNRVFAKHYSLDRLQWLLTPE